jgi:photosystem II stability/assembly factor-like uncharacterized protein
MKKNLLSILSFSALVSISNAQWVKQDTAFTIGSIPATSLNANDLFAVDGNVAWSMSERPGTTSSPQFFSNQFSKTVDGGATWTHGTIAALTDTTWRASNITAVDGNTALACFYGDNASSFGGVYRTTDGGATWTLCPIAWAGASSSFPNVVHMFDANNGMVMGDPAGVEFEIFTTSDGGATWTAVPAANKPNIVSGEYGIVDVYDAVGDTIFFGTNKGRIYKSVDKGLNWTAFQAQAATIFMNRVTCKNGTEVICSGAPTGSATTTYRRTVNGGTNWVTIATATLGTFFLNGYDWVPGNATLPGFWMSYGATTGFANFGVSISPDFTTAFTKVDTTFHYQLAVVDENTAFGVTRFQNTTGLNAFDKISSFAPYRAFLSLNNISQSNAKVAVLPNPSNGVFTVFAEDMKETVNVTVTDLTGKAVAKFSQNLSTSAKLDLTQLNKGVYLMNITDGKSNLVQKIVIE